MERGYNVKLRPRTMHSRHANHSTYAACNKGTKLLHYYIITCNNPMPEQVQFFILSYLYVFILLYFHTICTHDNLGQNNDNLGQNNDNVGQMNFGR